jgi:hypothetical protein
MPYIIEKVKKAYFVANAQTHKRLSKKPLTKLEAEKQRVAVALAEHRKHPNKSVSSFFG